MPLWQLEQQPVHQLQFLTTPDAELVDSLEGNTEGTDMNFNLMSNSVFSGVNTTGLTCTSV